MVAVCTRATLCLVMLDRKAESNLDTVSDRLNTPKRLSKLKKHIYAM